MFTIPFLKSSHKQAPAPVVPASLPQPTEEPVSPVDAAITTFLDALLTGDTIDYGAAYEACAVAREKGYTRPVQLWRVYHNALVWEM